MAVDASGTGYYTSKGDVWFDDGREIELLHVIYGRQDIDQLRNSPARVLNAVDQYARTKKYLMNVGEYKGKIVADLIAQVKPRTMVELGGYIGYSCLMFGDAVRKAGGKHYYSLERNPEFAAVIMSLVDLAGLNDVVKVIVGPSDASIKRLCAEGVLTQVDMIFLDHYKPAYKPDLKLCEELGIIRPGTVLAADNVIYPGNPPYLEYVRASVSEKRKAIAEATDESTPDARFGSSTSQQYASRQGEERLANTVGNPDLIYESRLINSCEPTGEPDGVEITKCIGVEA